MDLHGVSRSLKYKVFFTIIVVFVCGSYLLWITFHFYQHKQNELLQTSNANFYSKKMMMMVRVPPGWEPGVDIVKQQNAGESTHTQRVVNNVQPVRVISKNATHTDPVTHTPGTTSVVEVNHLVTNVHTKLRCPDFFSAIRHGKWLPRNYSESQIEKVTSFLKDVRMGYFRHPVSLQRTDGLCGNVSFGPIFRGLCDPDGVTPCCYKGHCRNRTLEQCLCEDCFDVRREIHPDLATYVLDDTSCRIETPTKKESVCSIMRDVTVHFLGDSLVRQFYTSMVSLVAEGGLDDVIKRGANQAEVQRCAGQRIYVADCRHLLVRESKSGCNGSVELRVFTYIRPTPGLIARVKSLSRKPYSFVVIGIGLHFGLNMTWLEHDVFRPLLEMKKSNTWPKVIWATPQSPGSAKSPRFVQQQTDAVTSHISAVTRMLPSDIIPVLDTYPLTQGLVSYDGTHHGKAVNDLKATILLNVIKRQRENGWNSW